MSFVNISEHKTNSNLKHNKIFYIKWIYDLYKPYKLVILLLIIMTIISTAVSVSLPLVIKSILDKIIESLNKLEKLEVQVSNVLFEIKKTLLLLFLVGVGFYFNGVYTAIRMIMNLKFEKFIKLYFFQHVVNKSYVFYQKFRTGDLVTRLTEDVKTWPPGLSWVACSGIFRAVNSSSIVLFCVISMYLINKYLTIIIVLTLPVIVCVFLRFEKVIFEKFKVRQEAISETNDILESTFSGIKVIKVFNAEEAIYNIYKAQLSKRITCELEKNKLEAKYNIIMDWLNNIGIISTMSLGSILVIKESITIGDLYAFFNYLGMIMFPLLDVPVLLYTFSQACISIDRLEEVRCNDINASHTATFNGNENLKVSCEISEKINKQLDSYGNLSEKAIVVCDVCFKYNSKITNTINYNNVPIKDESFSIKNISFSINRGEKIAIVGTIGSGKSTLLKLIAGILKPDIGEIIINGIRLASMEFDSYGLYSKCKIAYIPQEAVIFSSSVLNNIDLWRKIDFENIEEAAKIAQIHYDIQNLPNKYLERLGIKGIKLSGGQRQRIEIARALAGNPEIILMDDVTSALDAENEVNLWNAIQKKFPNSTCVVVTHRLNTVEICDKVLVINNGIMECYGIFSDILPKSLTLQRMIKNL